MGSKKWPRFIVEYGVYEAETRTFATYERAEHFARKIVTDANGGSALIDRADNQRAIDFECTTSLARVSMDGLGRVWADMTQAGDDLLRLAAAADGQTPLSAAP